MRAAPSGCGVWYVGVVVVMVVVVVVVVLIIAIVIMVSSLICQWVMPLVYSSRPAHALIPVNLRFITHSSSCVCIISTHGFPLFLHCRILDSIRVSCETFASFCISICTFISLFARLFRYLKLLCLCSCVSYLHNYYRIRET